MVKHLSTAILTGITALAFAVTPAVANDNTVTDQTQKLDKKLLETLKKAPQPTRVIIRTRDGKTTLLRNALQAHGDVVETQHNEIDALTAVVHGEDILAIANDPSVESVSIDAVVRSMGSYKSARTAVREVKASKAKARGKAQVAKAKATSKAVARANTKTAKVHAKRTRTRTQKPQEPKELLGDARRIQGLGYGMPTGAGIGVAIVDSGIDPDSQNFNITAFVDFTRRGEPVSTNPYDDFGHGTHLASLIASQGKESNGRYQGVAPGVRLIGLKVLDRNGAGRTSDVIAAIEYVIENNYWLGVDVINLSLGHPVYESAASDPMVNAVEKAHRAGIVVVTSAGNFGMNPYTHVVGYGGVTSPGNAPSAITVGAIDTKRTVERDDDYVAPFSSRGPTWIDGFAKPDLMAPGVGEIGWRAVMGRLFTAHPQLLFDDDDDDESDNNLKRFAKLSGTSMAAAEVSGVVALVLEANPNLTTNLVKAVLEYTATPLFNADGLIYDTLTQGAGEVNGAGAVTLAKAINTAPEYTDTWPIGEFTPATMFGSQDVAWAQNIVWGNYVVEAQAYALFARSEAWDDNIVWGTLGRSDDENIVWGSFDRDADDNIVWGTLAVWGSLYDEEQSENIVWGSFARGDGDENIVWGSFARDGDDNIVWGSFYRDGDDNIVWGNTFIWDDNIVWGNSLIGTRDEGDENIVWGNLFSWDGDDENIVWGNLDDENIVWGNIYREDDGENIVWGNSFVIGF